ncbi:MAG: hypothetical protein ACRDNB_03040 [Gaiellaceae bacterium]
MQLSIRSIAAVAVVALLVPVAAVAKDARVNGPTAIVGAGYFGGELELAMADGQRPVKIAGRAGYIGVLDLAGDLKVRCLGKGRVQKNETENGTVYFCAGRRGGQVMLLGSHFKFRGFATHYRALLPAGAAGSFHGRFVQCDPAAAATCKGPRPERQPAEPKERDRGEQRGEQRKAPVESEQIPSLEELAEMLGDE